MKKYIVFKIEIKLVLFLIVAFVLATVAGTISHEYGHFIAAKFRGINMKVHYAYTSYIYGVNLRGKDAFDRFVITLGGPLQTMFTGTLGLILLYIFKRDAQSSLNIKQWVLVLLSLFWLRQTANFTLLLVDYLLTNKYSMRSDEIRLAKYLEFPDWSILVPTALLGIIVSLLVIFKFVPMYQRFTFIIAGLVGGISGYILWLEIFGKMILP
jgi:hypothetical protein